MTSTVGWADGTVNLVDPEALAPKAESGAHIMVPRNHSAIAEVIAEFRDV